MENLKTSSSLALVMVVKNEAERLRRALNSMKGIVSEIVVAIDDTTTDASEEIARKFGAKIKPFKWRDDFSWARNFAQEGVVADWILVLDGHEYVEKFERLQEFLNKPVEALLVPVELENGFTFYSPRIYRNGLTWKGGVHNNIKPKTTEFFPHFRVKHDRPSLKTSSSATEREAQRDVMVPRVLRAELKKDPTNSRAYFHLGLFYEAHGKFRKALKFFRGYLRHSKDFQERWFGRFHSALCFDSMGRGLRAFWAVSRAESELPGRWETEKLKGLILFHFKKYARALPHFVASFELYNKIAMHHPWKRDDAHTWNLIGECFFNLFDFEKAHIAFSRASEQCKDDNQKKFYLARAKLMHDIIVKSCG